MAKVAIIEDDQAISQMHRIKFEIQSCAVDTQQSVSSLINDAPQAKLAKDLHKGL